MTTIAIDTATWTTSQRRAFLFVWEAFRRHDLRKAYELKRAEVSQVVAYKDQLLFVHLVAGLPKDEGTYAEVFCRNTRHYCITRRGQIQLLNPGVYDKTDGSIKHSNKRVTGRKAVYHLAK